MNQPDNTIPFSLEKWQEGYEAVFKDGTTPTDLHYFETATEDDCPLVGVRLGNIGSTEYRV